MTSHAATAAVGALAALGAMLLASPDADAEVSALCRVHLERVEAATGKHVSAAEDRRHWLERGQKAIYCSEDDARQDPEPKREEPKREEPKRDDRGDERSEDNRRRTDEPGYHCKITVTGLRCG